MKTTIKNQSKEYTIKLNDLRLKNLKEIFTYHDIKGLVNAIGLPISRIYFHEYVNNGVFINISRGNYIFSKDPIYYMAIESALIKANSKANPSLSKYPKGLTETQAIEFLKEHDYIVYKKM